ncbi:hypothetical protein HY224_03605 [Candidatus Uhrbacteria bacterium]|nr:hypothetical protein [Candidatus Uhrbacteria bacterium]
MIATKKLSKIDQVLSKLDDIWGLLEDTSVRVVHIEDEVTGIQKAVTVLQNEVAMLKQIAASTGNDIAKLQSDVSALQADVTWLKDQAVTKDYLAEQLDKFGADLRRLRWRANQALADILKEKSILTKADLKILKKSRFIGAYQS